MHKHHAAVRLLVILVCLVLVGSAIYVILAYGMGAQSARSTSAAASTTAVYFPIASTTPQQTVASVPTTSTTTTTLPSPSAPTSGQGIVTVTDADNGQTVQLTQGQKFIVQLGGGLKWSLAFDPASSVIAVPDPTTVSDVQGEYEASESGTTVLHATGAPICIAHQACPQLLAVMNVTFAVK